MSNDKVQVIFRQFPEPEYFDHPGIEIIAFISGYECNPGMVMSYQHVGQHGEASIELIEELKPCLISDSDAMSLLHELQVIGYDVEVVESFTE